MVVTFMLWSIGFVDLLAHTATGSDARILGLYSPLVFAIIIVHSLLFLVWLGVLLIPRSHLWIGRVIAWIQASTWRALLVLAVISIGVWNILTWPEWLKFPGFSTVLLLFLLLMGAIILLTKWGHGATPLFWRKAIVGLLALAITVEVLAQAVAYLGLMPGPVHWDAGYVPRGRIYQNLEGFGNGLTNNHGWYAPDFKLDPDARKIALIGDTFIQSLQIEPEQNLGVRLEEPG